MFSKKKECLDLLKKTLTKIDTLNYAEQFLLSMPDFLVSLLPIAELSVFFINSNLSEFVPYLTEKKRNELITPVPLNWNSNLIVFLKNSPEILIMKEEKESRVRFLKKTDSNLFDTLSTDIVIPLYSLKKLYGFVVIKATSQTYRELPLLEDYFQIFSNIIVPMILGERGHIESNRNYYRIYRMDRLAMVGELAASAAHEIKNPLAGISIFIKYFMELSDFKKSDIIEELQVMRDSVSRINEIVKSLLSFSRFKKKKIVPVNLTEVINASLSTMALKIPTEVKINKKTDDMLVVKTDYQQFQQVLINIIFNAVEAVDTTIGEITISSYISGRDQLPSQEMFNVSIKDNGPGIDESFREHLFQPFQTTKDEGTGLGLYTCYGLMKSLGGNIKINCSDQGTEVILSLPFSFDDEDLDDTYDYRSDKN